MSAFPNFTQVPSHVTDRLSERIGNPQKVSNLNAWIRVSSAAGKGLMLYSNPNINTFKAAGDENVSTVHNAIKYTFFCCGVFSTHCGIQTSTPISVDG